MSRHGIGRIEFSVITVLRWDGAVLCLFVESWSRNHQRTCPEIRGPRVAAHTSVNVALPQCGDMRAVIDTNALLQSRQVGR